MNTYHVVIQTYVVSF